MDNQISNIEYIVPSPDKPIGSLSFNLSVPIVFKEEQKAVAENEAADVVLSEATVALMDQLSKSIINDLEK